LADVHLEKARDSLPTVPDGGGEERREISEDFQLQAGWKREWSRE
jgi:hypothetical protein